MERFGEELFLLCAALLYQRFLCIYKTITNLGLRAGLHSGVRKIGVCVLRISILYTFYLLVSFQCLPFVNKLFASVASMPKAMIQLKYSLYNINRAVSVDRIFGA